MGKARVWRVGVDPVPTTKMCGDLADLQGQVDTMMTDIGAGKVDVNGLIAAANK